MQPYLNLRATYKEKIMHKYEILDTLLLFSCGDTNLKGETTLRTSTPEVSFNVSTFRDKANFVIFSFEASTNFLPSGELLGIV